MPSLRQQLHDHYAKQSLSPSKVEEILVRGRSAASGQSEPAAGKLVKFPIWPRRASNRILALAAMIALSAGILSLWRLAPDGRVPFDSVPKNIIAFFAAKPDLHHAPQDKTALHEWLVARGAPANFQIPPTLLPLQSFACDVVNVQGRDLYLSCYWREQRPDRGDHDLVHLLVGRKSDFRGAPASAHPQWKELEGWSFASWSEGDVVYTLASRGPAEQLRPFLAGDPARVFLAAAFFQ
jgi:hypothetical protein